MNRQLVDRGAESLEIGRLGLLLGNLRRQARDVERSAALSRLSATRIVDYERAHRACGIGEEVRLIRKRRIRALFHLEIRFVQQRRGAQRDA